LAIVGISFNCYNPFPTHIINKKDVANAAKLLVKQASGVTSLGC
jgi:hypothetical protein